MLFIFRFGKKFVQVYKKKTVVLPIFCFMSTRYSFFVFSRLFKYGYKPYLNKHLIQCFYVKTFVVRLMIFFFLCQGTCKIDDVNIKLTKIFYQALPYALYFWNGFHVLVKVGKLFFNYVSSWLKIFRLKSLCFSPFFQKHFEVCFKIR